MNHQLDHRPRAGRREWIGLIVLLLPLMLVSMDVSVLYFAVPYISRELAPSSTQQLWIFDIYGFVLAGLLITMGALGDRIGRRRLLLIGATGFGAASLLAAYSGSAAMLIAARAVLGIGGATLMPSTLGLVRNLFHDEQQRSTAIGIWTGATAGGVALGPILSGLLLEHFWWGSVFLINAPAMVLLLVLTPLLVPEFRAEQPGRFDLLGSLLSLLAVLPLIYGIKELARDGLHPLPLAAIGCGLAVGAVFIARQRSGAGTLIDNALLRRPGFGPAIGMNVLAMFGLVGFAIFTTQYLQSVLGLSALRAALWSVVPAVAVGGVAPLASVLAQRINRAHLVGAGFLIATAGFAVMTQAGSGSDIWVVLLGAGVYASGLMVVMSLATELAVGQAPPERASTASALLESGTEFGGALGMAILGSIGTAVYHHDLPGATASAARETLGGALATAAELPGAAGGALVHAARTAFVGGMHAAAVGAGLVMLLGAVLAAALLRRVPGAAPAPAEPATEPETNAV